MELNIRQVIQNLGTEGEFMAEFINKATDEPDLEKAFTEAALAKEILIEEFNRLREEGYYGAEIFILGLKNIEPKLSDLQVLHTFTTVLAALRSWLSQPKDRPEILNLN